MSSILKKASSSIIRTKLEREYCKISTSSIRSLPKQMSKKHQTTKNQNQPQATTITITIPTNKTISKHPTYFLFTLMISTSHTSNVLPYVFLTNLSFLQATCEDYFSTLSSRKEPFCQIYNVKYLFLRSHIAY